VTICVWHYQWALIGLGIALFVLVPTLVFLRTRLLKVFDPDLLNTPYFAAEAQWLPLFPLRRASLYAFYVASTHIAKRFVKDYDFRSKMDPRMVWICRAYLGCVALVLFNIFVLYPMLMPFCGAGFLPYAEQIDDAPRGPAQWEEVLPPQNAPAIPLVLAPAKSEPDKTEAPKPAAKKKVKKKVEKSAKVETDAEVSHP